MYTRDISILKAKRYLFLARFIALRQHVMKGVTKINENQEESRSTCLARDTRPKMETKRRDRKDNRILIVRQKIVIDEKKKEKKRRWKIFFCSDGKKEK